MWWGTSWTETREGRVREQIGRGRKGGMQLRGEERRGREAFSPFFWGSDDWKWAMLGTHSISDWCHSFLPGHPAVQYTPVALLIQPWYVSLQIQSDNLWKVEIPPAPFGIDLRNTVRLYRRKYVEVSLTFSLSESVPKMWDYAAAGWCECRSQQSVRTPTHSSYYIFFILKDVTAKQVVSNWSKVTFYFSGHDRKSLHAFTRWFNHFIIVPHDNFYYMCKGIIWPFRKYT